MKIEALIKPKPKNPTKINMVKNKLQGLVENILLLLTIFI